MEYASIYDLKSYVSFFLSKYDKSLTWEKLWYESQSWMIADFSSIIDQGDYNSSYIKLRMGEFDVFFNNGRKWRDWREPTKQVEWMYKMWNSIEYEEMLTNIKIIWNHWDETPVTIIYWTVRNWKIIDVREEWNTNNQNNNSQWETKRHQIRNEFWARFMPEFNKKSEIYKWRKIEDHWSSWFTAKSWIPEARFCFTTTWNYVAVELSTSKNDDKKYNKKIFDYLYKNKTEIEKKFWDNLLRERLDNKVMSRISYRLEWVNVYNKSDWEKIMNFLSENMIKLEEALRGYIDWYKN